MTIGPHSGVGRICFAAVLACAAAQALSPTALASNMPVKAPVATLYNWTGLYIGANAGYSWGRSRTNDTFTLTADSLPFLAGTVAATGTSRFSLNGAIAGGQIGYNWQVNRSVYGVETDLQWSGQKGSTTLVCPLPIIGDPCNTLVASLFQGRTPTATFNQRLQWFGTARGRLGALATSDTLIYLTGGLAYGGIRTNGVFTGYSAANGGTISTSSYSQAVTKAGWVAGFGVESRLFGRWTSKLEYLYLDLGTIRGTATQPANQSPLRLAFSSRVSDNILRVGLNYRFGEPN